jgi:hypothetical protein
MPTYKFKDESTGEIFEKFMSIHDLDKYKQDNPQLTQMHYPPNVVYGAPTLPSGFRDRMKEIQKNHPKSNLSQYT